MSAEQVTCPACGAAGEGNFCAQCGSRLPRSRATGLACAACGATGEPGAHYCSDCGTPIGRRPKPLSERLPWILSGLALVAFAVAISFLIGESTRERAEGMPPTGGVIQSPGAPGATDASNVDLSSMTGREAADRLFDRAMRMEAGGDTARARFFAQMGLRAYGGLEAHERDTDARFHEGLLHLIVGDPAAAGASADAVLAAAPDHLLGWILRARVAEARGDAAALAEANRRFLAALEGERAAGRPEYRQHAALIDERAQALDAAP